MAYFFKKEKYHVGEGITIKLAQEVSFLNKAAIKQTLNHLPENSKLLIDASDSFYIDHDVLELIRDFIEIGSQDKNVAVTLVGFKEQYNMANSNHVSSKEEVYKMESV